MQTASGSAKAEMTIEGIGAFAELRDFLYSRMRGARDGNGPAGVDSAAAAAGEPLDELAATLREVAAELRELRRELAGRKPAATAETDGPGPDA